VGLNPNYRENGSEESIPILPIGMEGSLAYMLFIQIKHQSFQLFAEGAEVKEVGFAVLGCEVNEKLH